MEPIEPAVVYARQTKKSTQLFQLDIYLEPLLLKWFNFNPDMGKHRLSLGMDK